MKSSSLIRVVMVETCLSDKTRAVSPPAHIPATLFSLPNGFALFCKRRRAFFGVGRGENVRHTRALQIKHVFLAPVARLRDDLFGRAYRQRAVGSNDCSQLKRGVQRLARLDQALN